MDDEAAYRIRMRAHELWAQGGRPNASSLAFWFAAEAELNSVRGFTETHRVEQSQTPCEHYVDKHEEALPDINHRTSSHGGGHVA